MGAYQRWLQSKPVPRAGLWATLRVAGLLLLADLLALALANVAAIQVRLTLGGQFELASYLGLWPLLVTFPLLFSWLRLYAPVARPPAEELRALTVGATLAYLGLGSAAFLGGDAELWSRGVYVMAWAFSLVLLPFARARMRSFCVRHRWWRQPAVVLGAGRTGEVVVRQLHKYPEVGLRPVAVLDDDPAKQSELDGVAVVGGLDLAPQMARETGIRYAIVAMPGSDAGHKRLLQLDLDHGEIFPHLIVIPPLVGYASMWVEAKDLGGALGLELKRKLLMPWPRFCKRSLDLLLIGLSVPLLIPLVGVLSLLVKLTSRGPVFYGQRRLGLGGASFKAWKFRSMVQDADAVLERYLTEHPELRAEWERDHKLRNDPRVTLVGRLLRKTSLDELPQLWNVLRGEMSLVGPRPIVEDEISKYGEQYALYKRVRPGISGLWQVSGRNDTSYDERVALDTYYVRNWSPWLDLHILSKTVKVVLFGSGAY